MDAVEGLQVTVRNLAGDEVGVVQTDDNTDFWELRRECALCMGAAAGDCIITTDDGTIIRAGDDVARVLTTG